MQYIQWDNKYNTGISIIDDQHKNFAKLLNALFESLAMGEREKPVEKALSSFLSYVDYHFSTEENMLAEHGYEDIDTQKAQHTELKKELNKLKDDFDSFGSDMKIDLTKALREWFVKHIWGLDQGYILFFKSKGLLKELDDSKIRIMEFFPWKKDYNLGHDAIDNQHRQLADIINQLQKTMKDPGNAKETRVVLKKVEDFGDFHLDFEENIMEKSGYVDIEQHKKEHDKFRNKTQEMTLQFEKNKEVINHELLTFLKNWFITHTQTADRKYFCR